MNLDDIVELFADHGMTIGPDDWVDAVEEVAYSLDLDLDVRTDYSGRAMYGRECVAYDVPAGGAARLGAAVTLAAIDLADQADGEASTGLIRALVPTRADGMGMGIVVY